MNCSIIDIGANTVRLTVFSVEGNKPVLLFNKKETVGLANYNENGMLSEEGVEILVHTLLGLNKLLKYLPVDRSYVFATASLRKVKNSKEVIEYVKEKTGIEIELLSGKDEANLGFLGISSLMEDIGDGLSVDIGGGSTEIVYFENSKVKEIFNLDEGCLSIHKRHVKRILPKKSELKEAEKYLEERMKEFVLDKKIDTIIGIGGTIRSTGKILLNLGMTESKLYFTSDNVRDLYELLKDKKSKTAFESVMKVAPDRIHTLQTGLAILITICDYFGIKNIRVSSCGLREGYLLNKVEALQKETV